MCAFSVDRARQKNGGGTGLQIGQRTEIHFESEGGLGAGRGAPGAMQ
jgi:hypothetical protein